MSHENFPDPAPNQPLGNAKELFRNTDPIKIMVRDEQFEQAYEALSDDERAAFDNWRIEQAAIRPPSIHEIIARSLKRPGEKLARVSAEDTKVFGEALMGLGVPIVEAPSADQVAAGIERAKQKVSNGTAQNELRTREFIGEKKFQELARGTKKQVVFLKEPLYVDTNKINGTAGHDSWLGRGNNGQDTVKDLVNGESLVRTSFERIADYATRESQLPPLQADTRLDIILTAEGPVLFTGGAHRTSAAIIRQEPLGFTALEIHQ